jgi:hypothetical protein
MHPLTPDICPFLGVGSSACKLQEQYEMLNVIFLWVDEQQIQANCSRTYAVACSSHTNEEHKNSHYWYFSWIPWNIYRTLQVFTNLGLVTTCTITSGRTAKVQCRSHARLFIRGQLDANTGTCFWHVLTAHGTRSAAEPVMLEQPAPQRGTNASQWFVLVPAKIQSWLNYRPKRKNP